MRDRTRLKIQNVRIIIMQDVIHSGLRMIKTWRHTLFVLEHYLHKLL